MRNATSADALPSLHMSRSTLCGNFFRAKYDKIYIISIPFLKIWAIKFLTNHQNQ